MATEAFTKESIVLLDGRTLELVPLNIRNTRVLQARLDEFQNKIKDSKGVDSPLEYVDDLLDMCRICLTKIDPELHGNPELIEDVLDFDSMFRILKVVAGVDFTMPQLQTAAALSTRE